jgi:hypothetical protein
MFSHVYKPIISMKICKGKLFSLPILYGFFSVSTGMITQVHFFSQNPSFLFFSPNPLIRAHTATPTSFLTFNQLPNHRSPLSLSLSRRHAMASNSGISNGVIVNAVQDSELDHFTQVANTISDVAGEVIRKYFRKKFDIVNKEDLSKGLCLLYLRVGNGFDFQLDFRNHTMCFK